MTVIRFTKADTARTPVGDVRIDGDHVDADAAVADITASWLAIPGKDTSSFVHRYSDWSNGYLCSAKVED